MPNGVEVVSGELNRGQRHGDRRSRDVRGRETARGVRAAFDEAQAGEDSRTTENCYTRASA